MRVYLTGADGMFGTAFARALRQDPRTAHWPLRGVCVRDFDIADGRAVAESVGDFAPDLVVHAAANAIVDGCEADPAMAMAVNCGGVRNVVQACRRWDCRLVYLSSDYVFDGNDVPAHGYRESDPPNPVNVYGATKLAGERIAALVPDHLIVRTSWLFGSTNEHTDNILALVRRVQRGRLSRLVHDQFGGPTYTADLARAVVHLLSATSYTGTVHVANQGSASWYEAGLHALQCLDPHTPPPVPAAMAACGFLAARPRDSTLDTGLLAALGHPMPSWQDAVRRFVATLSFDRTGGGMYAFDHDRQGL